MQQIKVYLAKAIYSRRLLKCVDRTEGEQTKDHDAD